MCAKEFLNLTEEVFGRANL